MSEKKTGRFSRLEIDSKVAPEELTPKGFAIEERDAGWYMKRAEEAYQTGYFEKALQLYTRALREDRALISAWTGQVRMLVELGEYKEAILWSDKALELFRSNSDLLSARAQAAARSGDTRTALSCSDASLQGTGTSPYRWIVRAEVLLSSEAKHADSCFKKALAEEDSFWMDHIAIASIYLSYGKATQAMNYARSAMKLEPTSGYVWFIQGECQSELGLISPARESYRRALEILGDYPAATDRINSLKKCKRPVKKNGKGFLSKLGSLLGEGGDE
ncbi:MAG: tetratricopeptide repeat protein [Thermodesulfobacteriota bacterium]